MSGSVLVALAQFAPAPDPARNVRALDRFAQEAVRRGAGLLIAPEYAQAFEPDLGPWTARAAEPVGGPFTQALGRIARERGIGVVAGMLERREGAGAPPFNTLIGVDAAGEVAATYRKQHLYDAFGQRESRWIAPGPIAPPSSFRVGDVRVGLQTCYDLRFPEVTRRLADAGCDLVAVPAEWVRGPGKERHWAVLLAARAIEDVLYVAAADHPAPVGVGLSRLVDPRGVALAGLDAEQGLALGRVDAARVAAARRENPALALRRYRVEPR